MFNAWFVIISQPPCYFVASEEMGAYDLLLILFISFISDWIV